jgi:gluconokinase
MLWRDAEQIKIVYLKGTFELIESRLKQRQEHFMKSDLLKSQFEDLEEPEGVILADISQTPSEIIEKIRKVFVL